MKTIELVVNERPFSVSVDETKPLLAVLREDLGLKGSRFGCGMEMCGACMVLVDGKPTFSCSYEVGSCEGKQVETVEGLSADGVPNQLQDALIEEQAGQCCYCLSGIQMSAVALLRSNPKPSRDDIVTALDHHLCRCGIHNRVIRAITRAAEKMEGDQ